MTETLASPCSVARPDADGCQRIVVSSENAVPLLGASASVGRSCAYSGSPTGARIDMESAPPGRKTETSVRWGPPAAACATPSSNASAPRSRPAPYTESARPAERRRNERRLRPVPAGVGIPGSIAGSPAPARAAPARRNCERLKSLQAQRSIIGSAHLHVGGRGDEHAQGVLAHRLVGLDLPGGHGGRQAGGGEVEKQRGRVSRQRRRAPEGQGGVHRGLRPL